MKIWIEGDVAECLELEGQLKQAFGFKEAVVVPEPSNSALTTKAIGVAEATEEAILNSLFRATPMRGHRGAVPALPLDRVLLLVDPVP